MNVLGLGELASILDRRAALLRDSPASDPARTALAGLVEWSYDLLHGDEKTILRQLAVQRGGASLPSLVALAGEHGLNEATVAYLVAALVDKSIVSASFAGGAARYDMLDTVREYVLDRLAESGGLVARPRCARPRTSRRWPTRRASRCAGPTGWAGSAASSWRTTTCGPRSTTRATRPTRPSPLRLGTLAWYFALADRVSEGRRFLELAVAATDDDAPAELRIEQLASLCYVATEELDVPAALVAGERAVSLAAAAATPWQRGFAQLTLSLALGQAGEDEHAAATADDAAAAFEAAGDDWGIAASSLIRAIGAAHAGDVSTVAASVSTALRHADALGYDAFRAPVLLLEGWAAERRGDGAAAVEAYRHAFELAGRIGFGDHAAFALAAWERARSRTAICGTRRSSSVRRSRQRRKPTRRWSRLTRASTSAQIAAASGNADDAARLYREVVAWSKADRPHQARESLFVALGGNPATAAEHGLADVASDGASWQQRRGAWQSVGSGPGEPSGITRSAIRRPGDEHDHERRPARRDPPPNRPAPLVLAGRRRRGQPADPPSPRRAAP